MINNYVHFIYIYAYSPTILQHALYSIMLQGCVKMSCGYVNIYLINSISTSYIVCIDR